MRKAGLFLIVIFTLGGVYLSFKFIAQDKKKDNIDRSDLVSEFDFGNYKIALPNGWTSSGTMDSYVTTALSGGCIYWESTEKGQTTTIPCKSAKIESQDYLVYITDTDDVSLGGGGSIPTIEEIQTYRNGAYQGDFKIVWEGSDAKLGLYYISGCLKDNLCIHLQSFSSTDSEEVVIEEFKSFVEELQITQ